MKMNKFFMLGLAGLAFAACSNEDEVTGSQFEGNGMVAVKIVQPSLNTRNAGIATSGDNGATVSLTGDLTITLTGLGAEGKPYEETITIDAGSINNETVLKFWNVQTPQKLTATINGGVVSYAEDADLEDLQVAAASAPAYGETTNITKKNDTEGQSPDLNEDNDTKENGTEQGASGTDNTKVYQMYEATITMQIPIARLEVSNIAHVTHTGAPDDVCEFTSLVANGAYLDGYTTIGGSYAADGYTAGGAIADYSFDGIHGSGEQSALRDVIGESTGTSFMSGETLDGPFTYNFFANGINPQFKIYFGTATGTNIIQPRYAIITNYKKLKEGSTTEYENVTFENGKIYRIKSATLYDKNILGDEGGNTLYGVEVIVEEATWSIVEISADWAE